MDWKKKLKFAVIVAAFAVLILMVLSNVFNMTKVSAKDFQTYRQGLYYLNKNDLENAFYNFSSVSKNSAIYEIALYRQAFCADELNDIATATKKYKMFLEKYPDSIFAQKAYYALGQNHFKEKDYSKAEKTFNELKKIFRDSDYSIAAEYYLGEIFLEKAEKENHEKNKIDLIQKAKNHFINYLKEAPNGRFALICANKIQDLGIVLDKNEKFFVGQAFFQNQLYNKALLYLESADINLSWAYLCLCQKYLGHTKIARELFETYYPKYSKGTDKTLLYKTIDMYAQTDSMGQQEGLNKSLHMAELSDAFGGDYILYRLCKYVDDDSKNNLYRKIYTKYPKGNFASDAVANLFWAAYKRSDYTDASLWGQIHVRDYQNTIAAPKILFWMAKLSEKKGYRSEAKGFYNRILEKYPDDYYAYRAYKHLNPTQNHTWKTRPSHRLNEKPVFIEFPSKHANLSDDSINLIENILKINDYKLLTEVAKTNLAVQSWINYKEGKYATSALQARDYIANNGIKPDFTDSIYKLAYQLHYQETINNIAKYYRLDPYLVTALIREESYFNTEANSSVGAKGLMQLMPATATFVAKHNGIIYSSLTNPKDNIKLGCAYLAYVREQLFGDDLFAVAAYNGGPNAVKIWKDKQNYRTFDEFIENIPYPETRDYVKKVFRSYWVYLNIYKN